MYLIWGEGEFVAVRGYFLRQLLDPFLDFRLDLFLFVDEAFEESLDVSDDAGRPFEDRLGV